MIYTIGIVDDSQEQLTDIKATIKINKSEEINIEFKIYNIDEIQDSTIHSLFNEIISDISENKIQSLIIDNKIVSEANIIEGVELYDKIKDILSDFPIVILTNLPEDSKKPDFIDSDKVYTKELFFKVKENYSKEKVSNIINSMAKYSNNRDRLNIELDKYQNELASSDSKIEITSKIIEAERKLSKYVPLEITQADLSINKEKIESIMSLINDVNKLIGD